MTQLRVQGGKGEKITVTGEHVTASDISGTGIGFRNFTIKIMQNLLERNMVLDFYPLNRDITGDTILIM